jgi:hypothetical protein
MKWDDVSVTSSSEMTKMIDCCNVTFARGSRDVTFYVSCAPLKMLVHMLTSNYRQFINKTIKTTTNSALGKLLSDEGSFD